MDDDMIRTVAQTNGVLMVNFMTVYLDPERTSSARELFGWYWFWHLKRPRTDISYVIDHIDHDLPH